MLTPKHITKVVASGILVSAAAFAQYKAEPAGAPPSTLPAAITQVIQKDGTKIVDAKGGTVAEIWLVSTMPKGPATTADNVSLTTVPLSSFLGVIDFPAQWYDRRGQTIKPGAYTLRYNIYPENGDHQGVAPQRDFFVLSRLQDDQDPTTHPSFNALVATSRKASGTDHPLVMSIWKADEPTENFTHEGTDWILRRKAGDTVLAMIMVGKVE
jgi:hypothetical protein